MKGVAELKEAVQTRSLTASTRALGHLAEDLAYKLGPPYTEIIDFKAKGEDGRFALHFEAKLSLHYSSLANQQEGLVFVIEFGGEAFSDSPNPPTHELFYAGVIRSFQVYGYGGGWKGNAITAHEEVMGNLGVSSKSLNKIDLDSFFEQLESR